uniref:Uncharacterized protein n=1 Tax=viral metagenome TaxID=1070528 RepID=A0A6M3XVW0_9ZZZZ
MKKLSTPERHQLKIARDTLKMSDAGALIMGGMTKTEALNIINRYHGLKPTLAEKRHFDTTYTY